MVSRVIQGDCREVMHNLIADGVRVQCVVTSPPYWGLRDYGVAGQLGLEPTYQQFIENMVDVFGLVRRLLADDGTLWLNLGDSYHTGAGSGFSAGGRGEKSKMQVTNVGSYIAGPNRIPQPGLKPKDLCGIPWRVAFALQDAGWWLRQDIIWSKPNPMPESVRDRCTKAHEYLFLMTKAERYYYDADAIKEPRASVGWPWVNGWASGDTAHTAVAHARDKGNARTFRGGGKYTNGQERSPEPIERASTGNDPAESADRNRRSVWTVATQPYAEAHFATFPEALVEPCILAGSRPGDVVFDPFMGSGTVASVAQRLGRRWLGAELNPAYIELIEQRTRGTLGLELSA